MSRVGVVVAQLGGPRTQRDVRPFIQAVFADPDVVPVPGGRRAAAALGWLVGVVRGPTARRNYRLIGGGSPIAEITASQATLCETELNARGHDAVCAVAMRYTRPDTTDAVRELLRREAERLVMLPLYPQFSLATTGSAETELRRVMRELEVDLPLEVIRSWHDHPTYLDVQTALVEEALCAPNAERPPAVVFSAHSIPRRLVVRGDPYPEEVEITVGKIVERLSRPVDARIGYQSRTGPVDWIGPGTEEVLAELAEEGWSCVTVVPISFVSDHIETLYEVDMLFRDGALGLGIDQYRRSEVLNDRHATGAVLADVVETVL